MFICLTSKVQETISTIPLHTRLSIVHCSYPLPEMRDTKAQDTMILKLSSDRIS